MLGTYEHTLDSKSRLSVPTRFRSSLSGPLVLAQDFERCLTIWPQEAYDAETDGMLSTLARGGSRSRKLLRFRMANAFHGELDGSGRVGIPARLAEWAGLQREVAVIGAGDHLEVWDREAWAQYNEGLADEAMTIAEGLDSE